MTTRFHDSKLWAVAIYAGAFIALTWSIRVWINVGLMIAGHEQVCGP